MSHDEFMAWVSANNAGAVRTDFIEFIAMFGAVWLEHAAENAGEPVAVIIGQCFSGEPVNRNLARFLGRGEGLGLNVH